MKTNKFSSTLHRRQIFMNWHQDGQQQQNYDNDDGGEDEKNWKHYNHINKLSCESIFVCRRVKHGDRHHLKMYVYLRLAFGSLCVCVWNKQMPNFSQRTTQMVLIRLLNWITNVKHGKWEFYYTKTLSRLIRWLGAFYYALFFRWEFHYKFNLRPTQKPHTCLWEGVRWIWSYE